MKWWAAGFGLFVVAVRAVAVTLEELSQRWLGNRSFDLGDLGCDYVGIALATCVTHKLFTTKKSS